MYDWDEEKNRTNKRKHGISFEEAAQMLGFSSLEDFEFDFEHSTEEEDRLNYWIAVATTGWLRITVSIQEGRKQRIVSARKVKRR